MSWDEYGERAAREVYGEGEYAVQTKKRWYQSWYVGRYIPERCVLVWPKGKHGYGEIPTIWTVVGILTRRQMEANAGTIEHKGRSYTVVDWEAFAWYVDPDPLLLQPTPEYYAEVTKCLTDFFSTTVTERN